MRHPLSSGVTAFYVSHLIVHGRPLGHLCGPAPLNDFERYTLGLVEYGVNCSSCVQQDLSCVCR